MVLMTDCLAKIESLFEGGKLCKGVRVQAGIHLKGKLSYTRIQSDVQLLRIIRNASAAKVPLRRFIEDAEEYELCLKCTKS